MKITPADITFLPSEKIVEIIAAGLAELAERGELSLVPAAQAQRLVVDPEGPHHHKVITSIYGDTAMAPTLYADGLYAVSKEEPGGDFRITHTPTGRGITTREDFTDAKAIADAMNVAYDKRGEDLAWGDLDGLVKVLGGVKQVEQVVKTACVAQAQRLGGEE